MHLSGQTPLLRAKNLEKNLGIDAIYLKLEGSNPTGHKNDRIAESLVQFALDNTMYFMSEWEQKPFIRSLAIQKITEEIYEKLPEPTDLWTQINGGYTLKSIYHESMRSWVNGTLMKLPMIKESIKLLKRLEHITITAEEAYSLAAFIYSEDKHKGTHTIILNDGKNEIDIKEISKDKHINKDEIFAITQKLLEHYDDSYEETADAVQKAIDIGVLKGNKGRGVATELINQAIEKTGGNLSLHVDIPNGSAKKLCEKMGFVHTYDRMLYKG